MILQSLLFPDNNICSEDALYFHREEGFILMDGYFNLFYLEKHHKYCNIDKLTLELCVRGVKAIWVMHDLDLVQKVAVDFDKRRVSKEGDIFQRLSITLPYGEYDKGVFWFKAELMNTDDGWNINGGFEGIVGVTRDINIAVGICTFKREQYVLRNLRTMLDYFENKRDIIAHYHVFLVDNGRTLSDNVEFKELKDKAHRIGGESLLTLIENRNNGGTGGFTRAMEEAIARKEEFGITNLMLLDDDAVFDPEIFLRLVSFLKVLKTEFEDITVGGAMWREDMPYMLYAFGEYHNRFSVYSPAHMLDLRKFDNCIRSELTEPDTTGGLYSGWWCCTYNMKIITKDNLPMPLFIHFDDILFCRQHSEYGIALIPGIGVWHQGFELRFPGVNHYYNTRNQLITSAVMDDVTVSEVIAWAIKQLTAPLLTLHYEEMKLAYKGIRDFLKGPEWLDRVDGEKLHCKLTEEYKNNVRMKHLGDVLDKESYEWLKTSKLCDEARKKASMAFWKERRRGKCFKKVVTLNGWFLPPYKKMGYYCNADSPWSLYRKGKVLLYEPESERGYIETRRFDQLIKCTGMVIKSAVLLRLKYRRVSNKYRIRAGIVD